jgi:hypothetical protein
MAHSSRDRFFLALKLRSHLEEESDENLSKLREEIGCYVTLIVEAKQEFFFFFSSSFSGLDREARTGHHWTSHRGLWHAN